MIPSKMFKNKIHFCYIEPAINKNKALCFIPGFKSDFITSKKSLLVYDYALENKLGFLSWNHADKGNIVDWYKDGIELIKEYCKQKDEIYFIVSSMGLWISLLITKYSSIVPKGILSMGGGLDFTERWLNEEVPINERNNKHYIWKRPTEYDSSGYYEIPVSFLMDSKPALLLNTTTTTTTISIDFPIYLIHGILDTDVTIETAARIHDFLISNSNNVKFFKIKDGNHRLSRSQDLDFILNKIKLMLD